MNHYYEDQPKKRKHIVNEDFTLLPDEESQYKEIPHYIKDIYNNTKIILDRENY
jgi:hypothetical protein